MQSSARAPSPGRTCRAGFDGGVWRLVSILELALKVRRERRMLLGMDDRALKDMGFSRGDADGEAQRPFWDIPRDRLRR